MVINVEDHPMVKWLSKWVVFLILIGIILLITVCCRLFDDRIELARDYEQRYYSINPETIIKSLANGNTDVFTLLLTTPEVTSSTTLASISWNQADYLRIAQVLHEQSWGIPVRDQNMDSMLFRVDCADIDRGTFTYASFDFFQIIRTEEEETRIEYTISIRPSENSVYTSKQEFGPNMQIMKPIELERYRITAEQALRIAEEKGGSEKRLEIENDCYIDALAPGPDHKGWRILYGNSMDNINFLLEIAVNPQTGDYKILFPK